MSTPTQPGAMAWQITAIRFARLERQFADVLLLCPQPLAGEPLAMDYSYWLLRDPGGTTVLVDTGYSEELARRRGRTFLHDPLAILRSLEVAPADVGHIILTHLHYDHAGNLDKYPNARITLHEAELPPAATWQAREPAVRFAYEPDHVAAVTAAAFEGRLDIVAEDTVHPYSGIELHRLPGHTPGHLAVRVWTQRGWVLLAGDSIHVDANLTHRRPYPLYSSLRDSFGDYDTILRLAVDRDHVIAGHEPSVIDRYPASSAELVGQAARLDLAPLC